jgi:formate dehydrogenase subunit delta
MTHSQSDEEPHIATTPDERLVYMVNQIARFFSQQPHEAAVKGVATHLADFWDPRMRARIRAHLAAGGEGLAPLAREGVANLEQ